MCAALGEPRHARVLRGSTRRARCGVASAGEHEDDSEHEWLLLPPRFRLSLRTAFLWVVVPVVYTVYSVVRGALVGFYCYPFFNPSAVGGYGGVAVYCVLLLAAFIVLALVIRAVGNALQRRAEARTDATTLS